MALFTIKNQRDLIVLNGLTSQTTAAAFATSAAAGEGKLFNQYGATPTGKEKFAIYVKHLDGRIRKSDVINPDAITYFKKQVPVSPVLASTLVTVTTATVGDLYEVAIKVWNDGALSMDDTILLNAYYTAVTGDTTTTIATGLAASYNAAQTRMGQSYFTCTSSGAAVTFQSTALPFVTGKKDGRPLDYAIKATQVSPTTAAIGSLTVATTPGVVNPCSITYLQDLEFQTRGAFGDSLRGLAYPFDFALQSDINSATVYTLYEFDFHYDTNGVSHDVQKSPRHLTVAVPAANVAAFDATLATVRQVIDLTTAATDGQQITWTTALGTYHPSAQ